MGPEKKLSLREKAKQVPSRPGIYFFLNKSQQIIYIGRARNLRDRLRSYFLPTSDLKVHSILAEATDLDYLVTDTEKDAAFLENNFIRRFQPKFNLRLKDDKSFPMVKINLTDDYPSIGLTRRVKADGARYFGPFHPAHQARKTIDLIAKYFHLRTCSGALPKGRKRPCLEYDLGMCSAPCVKLISKEEYQENVQNALLFLEGKSHLLLPILEKKMKEAAQELEFELAAHWRDLIQTVKSLQQKPKTSFPSAINADLLGWAKIGSSSSLFAFFLRQGKVVESAHQVFEQNSLVDNEEDAFFHLFQSLYSARQDIAEKIHLSLPLKNKKILVDYLWQTKKKKVRIISAHHGKYQGLLRLANLNAEIELKKRKTIPDSLISLATTLQLPSPPRWIEAFDISTTGGVENVGALVVFENGQPLKSEYRRFRISSHSGPNDLASLQEVLSRRYSRLIREKKQLPDLILVDGGKGQLRVAQSVLSSLEISSIPVIALAKKKETIYRDLDHEGLNLDPTSPALKLLQWIRDEVHRFAITFHRKRRAKQSFSSLLDDIPGIGRRRKALLLQNYSDLTSLRQANFDEVAHLIGRPAATNLFARLQSSVSSSEKRDN